MDRIKVAVSPFYGRESFTDELTNITFERNEGRMTVYSIPANLDLTNIRKAIRLNSLIHVEGNLGEGVDEVVIETPVIEEPKIEEPKQEEDTVEEPVEAPEEAPVEEEVQMESKAAPKKAAKKTTKKATK